MKQIDSSSQSKTKAPKNISEFCRGQIPEMSGVALDEEENDFDSGKMSTGGGLTKTVRKNFKVVLKT